MGPRRCLLPSLCIVIGRQRAEPAGYQPGKQRAWRASLSNVLRALPEHCYACASYCTQSGFTPLNMDPLTLPRTFLTYPAPKPR